MAIYIALENIDVNTRAVFLRDTEIQFFPNDDNLKHYYSILYSENIDNGEYQGRVGYDPATVKGVELNENLEHMNDIKHQIRDIMLRN